MKALALDGGTVTDGGISGVESTVLAVVTDGTSVYWLDRWTGGSTSDGAIKKCAQGGCASPTIVVDKRRIASMHPAMRVTAKSVLWIEATLAGDRIFVSGK